MNKLVIIGNGFDLAHGLETSYEDFLLWEINEAFKQNSKNINSPLFTIESNYQICKSPNFEPFEFKRVSEFLEFYDEYKVDPFRVRINYSYKFVEHLINCAGYNWIDIEKEYYKALTGIYKDFEKFESLDLDSLKELNKGFDLIKSELEKYLSTIKTNLLEIDLEPDIIEHLNTDINHSSTLKNGENILFLNFNYTDTINNYVRYFKFEKSAVNFIHGKLNDKNNPIIFGYGDESDLYFERMEKLDEVEFLKHLKSNSYHLTSNYRNLFRFLDGGRFNVYIMGHSCGLSDKVLFKNIFEHSNCYATKIYYYLKEDGTNDFSDKTLQLAKHIKIEDRQKYKERTIPLDKSKPLTKFN